jgi:hypothetical protein
VEAAEPGLNCTGPCNPAKTLNIPEGLPLPKDKTTDKLHRSSSLNALLVSIDVNAVI